jgi:hypothetical protein
MAQPASRAVGMCICMLVDVKAMRAWLLFVWKKIR